VELQNGVREALGEVRRAVEEQLGLQQTAETKLAAALTALGEKLPERDERVFALDHADRLLDVAHKTFGRQLGRLFWNEPGTRLGVDPDYVHDMRVACRRLRTALEVLADGYPETLRENLRGELPVDRARSWEGARPGRRYRARRRARGGRHPVRATGVSDLRAGALGSPRGAAPRDDRAPRFGAIPDGRVPSTGVGRDRPAPRHFGARGSDPRVPDRATDHRALEEGDAGGLREGRAHDGRAGPPRAPHRREESRYAIEYFAELDGPGALRRARRIATLQDFLGDHRDASLLLSRMKKYARTVPKKDRELVMGVGSALGGLERAVRIRRGDLRLAWERAVKEEG